ncbi:MAG: hypothetical protein GY835_02195 [bacterium]|nr:hypothetical protein [bacterium]
MRNLAILFIILVTWCAPSEAAVHAVSADGSGIYPTIQAAINACEDGDVVELADGIYSGDGNRNIEYLGKAIEIRSQSGNPEQCVIECDGSSDDPHTGIEIINVTGGLASLRGVHIRNGHHTGTHLYLGGGAVYCSGSTVDISDCHFSECYAARAGGAVFVTDSNVTLTQCRFTSNRASENGGGLKTRESEVIVRECLFEGNSATVANGAVEAAEFGTMIIEECEFYENSTGSYGGAFGAENRAIVELINCVFARNTTGGKGGAINLSPAYSTSALVSGCTIYGNEALEGGAIFVYGAAARVSYCTLYANVASSASGIFVFSTGTALIENTIIANGEGGEAVATSDATAGLFCSDLYGNAGGDWTAEIASFLGILGNISEDPLLCAPDENDYHLNENSPCSPFTPPNHDCDLIGALPVQCGLTPVERTTWGKLKSMYR